MTERQNRERPATGDAWSYLAGEKGRNRVRVYDRDDRDGIWIDYRDEHGTRVRQPLGYADRDRAKLAADDVAAKFGRQESAPPAAIDLRTLFDNYLKDVTPQKSKTAQAHDRRTLPLFVTAVGAKRRPASLNRRDWDSYIQRRRRGELAVPDREGKPVRARVLEQDCNLLNAVLNWAVRAGDGAGGYLLERNPLTGLSVPREESPKRAVLTRSQYDAVRTVAGTTSAQLECFVVVAWFTGHRSKSIRLLRWSDVDLDAGRIHWRGENDKIQHDHWNPLHAEAITALKALQKQVGAIGDAWVFPSARKPVLPWSEHAVVNVWKRLAERANIPVKERYGWHSFRRAFANTLRDVALRDLKDLGGWKTTRTLVEVYQQPDEDAQRRGLDAFGTVGGGSSNPKSADSEGQRAPGTGTNGT